MDASTRPDEHLHVRGERAPDDSSVHGRKMTIIQRAILNRLVDAHLRARAEPEGRISTVGGGWAALADEAIPDAWDRLVAERFQARLADQAWQGLAPLVWWTTKEAAGVRVLTTIHSPNAVVVKGSRVLLNGEQIGPLANYLTPGPHWEAVRGALRNATRTTSNEEPAGPRLSDFTIVRRWFNHVPRRTSLSDALIASGRVTGSERNVAFGHPAVLLGLGTELELWPLQSARGQLFLPFRLQLETEFEGAIQLDAVTEPAPLLTRPNIPEVEAEEAWAMGLIAGADLLCRIDPEPADGESSAYDSLVPTDETRALIDAAVVGHRRRLSGDRNSSPQAQARARALGITLSSHQTWVRPHSRGLAPETLLRFRWRPHLADHQR